tara:strand:- start:891 stop:1112 length:222 start_codon:yes stop_codon:yes gene_type:complete
MKRVALVLVGLTVGMLLNSAPTQAGKDEQRAMLCKRFRDQGGVEMQEQWLREKDRDVRPALVLSIVKMTLCDE